MKQILFYFKNGTIELADIPAPQVKAGHLLIQTQKSLISSGTERSLLEFGQASWIEKIKQQPQKVEAVLEKIKRDGVLSAVQAVFSKLDEPIAIGYCNAGVVLEVGAGVEGFAKGDRVISNGPHAQVVSVPKNLCCKIPEDVDFDEASFTVLGAIALHASRLLQTSIGENVVVYGLGLVGLMAGQILKNSGCRVIGVDINPARVALAKTLGIDAICTQDSDSLDYVHYQFKGIGADGVLITASSSSNEPLEHAAQMCRRKGRIVLVGVVDLTISRNLFYEKELSFQVSCSYGPGRYDTNYEEKGQDYPIEYVRWTENRNFEALLDMLASGSVQVRPLISETVAIEEAVKAYDKISQGTDVLGVLLDYSSTAPDLESRVSLKKGVLKAKTDQISVGIIGAGRFTAVTLLPRMKALNVSFKGIASDKGISSAYLGKKYGFEYNTTDYQQMLKDSQINTIFITTRHHQHASMVQEALSSGKHVFVEKPLAMNGQELKSIKQVYEKNKHLHLMVGFNRRFSPQMIKAKELLKGRKGVLSMVMTVNSGCLPKDHWVQDKAVGGGRIIGEGCHFIDLLQYLTGSPIKMVYANKTGGLDSNPEDQVSIELSFADGSIGTIHYFSNGSREFPKEKLDIFCEEKVLSLNNFKELTAYGYGSFQSMNLFQQDKGHEQEVKQFIQSLQDGKEPLISFEELCDATLASFAAVESAQKGVRIDLAEYRNAVLC